MFSCFPSKIRNNAPPPPPPKPRRSRLFQGNQILSEDGLPPPAAPPKPKELNLRPAIVEAPLAKPKQLYKEVEVTKLENYRPNDEKTVIAMPAAPQNDGVTCITIPCAKEETSKDGVETYFVYVINIRLLGGKSATSKHRYSEVANFHKEWKSEYPGIDSIDMPRRNIGKDDEDIARRCLDLQIYFREICTVSALIYSLAKFLSVEEAELKAAIRGKSAENKETGVEYSEVARAKARTSVGNSKEPDRSSKRNLPKVRLDAPTTRSQSTTVKFSDGPQFDDEKPASSRNVESKEPESKPSHTSLKQESRFSSNKRSPEEDNNNYSSSRVVVEEKQMEVKPSEVRIEIPKSEPPVKVVSPPAAVPVKKTETVSAPTVTVKKEEPKKFEQQSSSSSDAKKFDFKKADAEKKVDFKKGPTIPSNPSEPKKFEGFKKVEAPKQVEIKKEEPKKEEVKKAEVGIKEQQSKEEPKKFDFNNAKNAFNKPKEEPKKVEINKFNSGNLVNNNKVKEEPKKVAAVVTETPKKLERENSTEKPEGRLSTRNKDRLNALQKNWD